MIVNNNHHPTLIMKNLPRLNEDYHAGELLFSNDDKEERISGYAFPQSCQSLKKEVLCHSKVKLPPTNLHKTARRLIFSLAS